MTSGQVRQAMRTEKALQISYEDEGGNPSERAIWPVQLAYYEGKQVVAAWCTLRESFRNFRTDRIAAAEPAEGRFGKVLRIKGRGLTDKSGKRGDQLVNLEVSLPRADAELEAFAERWNGGGNPRASLGV